MSVIIRLQNLPWSANALDIRQFFKGLSIPEGGVHIVGGEMGDAFIAFSTDEDARQAMMKDRGKLNETQVRLLLSSRTEMQKVIEVARQQSLLALQKAGAIPIIPTTAASSATPLPTPQPPVITTNSLQNILGTQLGAAPSFQTYQQQAGITLIPALNMKADSSDTKITSRRESNESSTRDRRRSGSRDRRRSRSRDRDRSDRSSGRRRRERSRTRSRERERDRKGGRQRSMRRSRSRDRSRDRSRERSRDQNRINPRTNRNSRDGDTISNNRYGRDNASRSSARHTDQKDSTGNNGKAPSLTSWSIPPINAYETNASQNPGSVIAGQVQRSNPLNAFATAIDVGMSSNVSNAYTTSSIKDVGAATTSNNAVVSNAAAIAKALPSFQNYTTSTTTTNNYSVNILPNPIAGAATLSDAGKTAFALQNPYTAALRAATSNSNSQDSNSSSVLGSNMPQGNVVFPGVVLDKSPLVSQQQLKQSPLAGSSPQNSISQQAQPQLELQQQTIAFANTNPYAQMYPNLFAQAAAAGTGIANPVRNSNQNQNTNFQEQKFNQRPSSSSDYKVSQKNAYSNDAEMEDGRSCSIKISDMCNGTTYSDLRKFFSGLFIPHNGIKMINDKNGARTGVAYIQFSRSSCVSKALIRNNTFLKTNRVMIETVPDEEFQNSEDSFKPYRDRESYNRYDRNERNDPYGDGNNRGGYENRYDFNKNCPSQGKDEHGSMERDSAKQQFDADTTQHPFSVLYIEDIPAMATELDIMKMFSSFTIFDILLTVSPGNRREFTAYVKFSREDEAKAALLEYSRHVIGHRKLRIRPAKVEEMEKAKEKLRLANEQLKKEEQALAEVENEAIEDNINDDYDNMDDDNNGEDDLTIAENETNIECANDIKSSNLSEQPNIPSIFDLQAVKEGPSDPRLRRQGNKNRFTDTNNAERNNRFADNKNDNSISIGNNKNEFPADGDCDGDNAGDISPVQNMRQQQFNGPHMNAPFNAPAFSQINSMENNFIILKNCDYNTRINDVAQLMLSANLDLKHIEPLVNERKMPTGEFIVEFTNSDDALRAFNRFNNTDFRNRNLRVRDITPQEIADRIGKPFMNYFPGGGGRNGPPHPMPMRGNFDFSARGRSSNVGQQRLPNFRMNGGNIGGGDRNMGSRFGNNMINRGGVESGDDRTGNFSQFMRGGERSGGGFHRNFNAPDEYVNDEIENQNIDDNENNMSKSDNEDDIVSISSNGGTGGDASSGIPEKFSRPGCVLAMENVPFKADLKDIIEFFKDFDVVPDDIIRRFNDDGSATGDARVAFSSPAQARAAYDAKRQKSIFNRTIYLSPL